MNSSSPTNHNMHCTFCCSLHVTYYIIFPCYLHFGISNLNKFCIISDILWRYLTLFRNEEYLFLDTPRLDTLHK